MSLMSQISTIPFVLCALVVALFGCHAHEHGDGDGGDDPVSVAIKHGCIHFGAGPAKVVTLAVASDAAPDLTIEHHLHDLTFVDLQGGQKGGDGVWKVADKGEYLVMLSDDVPVVLLDKDGQVASVEKTLTKPVAGCAAAALGHLYDLTLGTWTLRFGPTAASGVKMTFGAVEGGAHAAH